MVRLAVATPSTITTCQTGRQTTLTQGVKGGYQRSRVGIVNLTWFAKSPLWCSAWSFGGHWFSVLDRIEDGSARSGFTEEV